ncbi:NRDE protein-domain-containing protein [Xylariaceae sp. FL0804]|nr:NRDE protein-domain-containing protein [Xylariaceae sp. FL0804]
MCIILLSTAHPKYALIVLDNRDEYVLRPTSRPHWWTHGASGSRILSARDLHRRERGTWLGVSRAGRLAVLTNYHESSQDDPDRAICGARSRGGMVTAWLGAPAEDSLDDFVHRMLEGRMVKGVGGFSLICGDLRAKARDGGDGDGGGCAPLVVLSNRCERAGEVPRICERRGGTYGLSNTIYAEPASWPKLTRGKELLEETIREAAAADEELSEEDLTSRLFAVLDDDRLPREPKRTMQETMEMLRQSIFIPAFGDDPEWKEMADAAEQGAAEQGAAKAAFHEVEGESESEEALRAEPTVNFMKGAYGTQRQTLVLLDWEGNVTYVERALWDAHGNPVERGKGDRVIRYKIEDIEE